MSAADMPMAEKRLDEALVRRALAEVGVHSLALTVSHADVMAAGAIIASLGTMRGRRAHVFGRYCRVCGCTDLIACRSETAPPCHWVAPGVCSVCAPHVEGLVVVEDQP